MNYEEALSYIHSISWLGSRPGLSRTRELLDSLGDPQKELKFIHIAGTNGKGSVAAMLSSVLTDAGYRTGLYTSPFIDRFNERIKLNGADIPDAALAELTERIRPHAEAMSDHPTEFELITALAFMYFAQEKCDIVVLEAGMGGELDSTNVIDVPELAILTSISLDHTAILGDTIEKIAATKAGIIKEGGDVVCAAADEAAKNVVFAHAERKKAFIYLPEYDKIEVKEHTVDGYRLDYKSMKDIHLALTGSYQAQNAAVVLRCIEVLNDKGWNIPVSAIKSGLSHVVWPARFEILRREPLFIVDGGHNPQGIRSTLNTLDQLLPEQKLNVIFGVMRDKSYNEMLALLRPYAYRLFAVTPDNPRALKADELAKAAEAAGIMSSYYESIPDAIDAASARGERPTLALGSLFMSGEIRRYFGK